MVSRSLHGLASDYLSSKFKKTPLLSPEPFSLVLVGGALARETKGSGAGDKRFPVLDYGTSSSMQS